ncbi:6-phosphogluconate dehydrogenase [Arthrobacter sp. StoSoilB3]|uniref:6-phosphogluconate dehydrogenase n=1 Tax=Paenarthrobacter nicotinovorans TaxID=29320 RepID=A0ABT9TM86_PAENI|nr:decarboxylating 6-phosphogluconate dehydrogenase [Paenarthrobacter nicotinovorans]KIA75277.1 6-phosphogluconate dehydrogenase [Arthrobacter sp. MWB30]KQQ98973.1 6-phosphogluconate dehydrogenase [Arthrobacter sp. Leaf145]QOT20043.1 decarboxylating 6-phosphogluconate dehydrogenase [Paenarthrobacter sp. YJN-D]SKB81591.1 6-phosphogluconate dehydrogenase (decarboxylating) [Arthrobacter sp. 31Cvi3.1E]BCW08721.1 6-phosphogluconate dehydrogenase [Arthrobacter sp. NtRootA2]BCW16911.1 6-phosphogluco
MHIGLIGLGKMGFNMRERMRKGGIEVTGFDRNPEVTDAASVDELIAALPTPRLVWVMVPSGEITDAVVTELGGKLSPGDMVIDGGNSRFTEDQKHAAALAEKGIRFADCGVSGGVWGLQNGYGLMAGGADEDIELAMPVFDALRPEGDRADSFVHVGGVGAGHYAKMVHNGIEYGLMQAYAEGYELLAAKDIVKDLPGTFRAWQKGTVVRSWLLDLMVKALDEDPGLASIDDYVEDSGEGRWTVEEAIANAVPAPAITAALFARFASREDNSPAMKMVSALRHQFGGHATRPAN